HLSLSYTHTPPHETFTLSLHDALPISRRLISRQAGCATREQTAHPERALERRARSAGIRFRVQARISGQPKLARIALTSFGERRSEEHTSELQSRENLVCRLLLEKKKK